MIYALQARIVEDVSPWKPVAMDFTLRLEAMNKATANSASFGNIGLVDRVGL